MTFLAATSSSRSDDATLLACLLVSLSPYFFEHLQFATLALQFATLASCNTCNLQHLQFAKLAICNTCNMQHLQFTTPKICNTCDLKNTPISTMEVIRALTL